MSKCQQPYTFVSIVTGDIKTHEAIFHDGRNNHERLSGRIECTLTVKTPMLVGHYQYKADQIEGHLHHGKAGIQQEPIYHNRSRNNQYIIENPADFIGLPESFKYGGYLQNNHYIVHKNKSVIEPLFYGTGNIENQKVLISGTSLKGMLRQSLGAITNSPMERVTDRQFGYRPGLCYANQRGSRYTIETATATSTLNDPNVEQTLEINFRGKPYILDKMMVDRYWQSIATYSAKRAKQKIAVGDTLYVEYDHRLNKIVSFGKHNMYRWAYSDTTQKRQHATTGYASVTRPECASPEEEVVNSNTAQLTAVRRLLGYVDSGPESQAQHLHLGIGEQDYARLAGRIAINCAIEQTADKSLAQRFVQNQTSFNIPLKILSSPKASAVECYLDQSQLLNAGLVNTYGDFPGFAESGVELAGRKFYYRWQAAVDDFKCDDQHLEDNDDQHLEDNIVLAGNQAAIARYISEEGGAFKFTLHFKDLEPCELGAVLAALSPQRVAEFKGKKGHEYWQQIGHGRPLGMGSIDIHFDHIHILDYQTLEWQQETQHIDEWLKAFTESPLCHAASLDNWLALCQCGNRKTYMKTKEHGTMRKAHIVSVRKQDQ